MKSSVDVTPRNQFSDASNLICDIFIWMSFCEAAE